jgi:hypothetical protein
MGLDATFAYDTDDKGKFEVEEFVGRSILPFLQFFPRDSPAEVVEQFKSTVLFPSFIEHLTNGEEIVEPEPWEMSTEEWEAYLDGKPISKATISIGGHLSIRKNLSFGQQNGNACSVRMRQFTGRLFL